jgi:hypothetical protein
VNTVDRRTLSLAESSRRGALVVAVTPDTLQRPSRHQRQFATLVIGAGLLSGLALTTLSPRQWSRLGALVFGGSAWLLRSPIGPALLAAVLARGIGTKDAPPEQ